MEAQLAMRAVLGRIENEPYAGSRLPKGDVLKEFADPDEAATYYRHAFLEHMKGFGVNVREVEIGQTADAVMANIDQAAPEGESRTQFYAPWETIAIAGTVPRTSLQDGRRAAAMSIEACAEIVRVLTATAIVAAAKDCMADEEVVLFIRKLEMGHQINFELGNVVGICRLRAIVYCSSEPRVSYLLGSSYGMAKPLQLGWPFPLVEHLYGPNRLRWCDMRSPGYEPMQPETAKIVVAS